MASLPECQCRLLGRRVDRQRYVLYLAVRRRGLAGLSAGDLERDGRGDLQRCTHNLWLARDDDGSEHQSDVGVEWWSIEHHQQPVLHQPGGVGSGSDSVLCRAVGYRL